MTHIWVQRLDPSDTFFCTLRERRYDATDGYDDRFRWTVRTRHCFGSYLLGREKVNCQPTFFALGSANLGPSEVGSEPQHDACEREQLLEGYGELC